jgi:hypothetical protein
VEALSYFGKHPGSAIRSGMMARVWIAAIPVVALAAAAAGTQFWRSEQSVDLGKSGASTLVSADAAAPVRRAYYGRRLEPQESVVLHGAGQSDEVSFASYTKVVAPAKPMLTMSYVDLHDDVPAYFEKLKRELARYPNLLIPQIGLSLNSDASAKHYEAGVARGDDDAKLKQFCEGLESLDRPAFIRIGYEFNAPWNGYSPTNYVAAFRHIVEYTRGAGLGNVAFVWDWSPGAELDAESGGADVQSAAARYMRYYPGDAWVDWWGLNVFGAANLWSTATSTFLADADRHRMPVMIGESTPKEHSVSEGNRLVDAWYKPYFGLIRSSPGVKAFCYIDWNWGIYPQWADWGNARIEDNADVLRFYRREVGQSFYAGSRDKAHTLSLLRAK